VYTANIPGEEDLPITREDISTMTVPQLKQQLRLRGLKVGGLKSELMDRLVQFTAGTVRPSDVPRPPKEQPQQQQQQQQPPTNGSTTTSGTNPPAAVVDAVFTKAVSFAKDRGKELVDVTDFLDPQDAGKSTRSIQHKEPEHTTPDTVNTGSGPETWGSEARIVDDYEGRSVVVDSLSRTMLEYKGSNQTFVPAFVVASRDALQGFLAGGRRARNTTQVASTAEASLYEIQSKREQASRNPIRQDQEEGLDEGDEPGFYKQVMNRDYSDWGKYTQTGAQLSSQEVQGILLLSDVYGAFTNDTRVLAEKIAFECQPVVVMVPDLFRGAPWDGPTTGKNSKGQTYEQWRARQDDVRVSVDIRAAAACLRDQYGVSSVVVWGTCYGGGKALEAAAGYFPNDVVHDVDGSVGPPTVDPMVCVAWYPTRYNANALFGNKRQGALANLDEDDRTVAIIALFGECDEIPGATSEDAATLKEVLEEDARVKDYMVKIFPDQGHGFAHVGLSLDMQNDKDSFEQFVDDEFGGAGRVALDSGDAEIACLLSTAFMETYSRVFLPTTGAPISKPGEEEDEWSSIKMKDLKEANSRDIRAEIEDALENFSYQPSESTAAVRRSDDMDEDELKEFLMSYAKEGQNTGIKEDDDIFSVYEKLTASDENYQIF
jgi:dienelactone hydrolase